MSQSLTGLNALNFFMADVRDGLGPFLGVFLQDRGWEPGAIGLVMTIGGLAGMLATAPLGFMADQTRWKRTVVVVSALAIILSAGVNYLFPSFWVTATAQIIGAIGGAAIGPFIAAITLGIVRQAGFARQLGHNEAFNHAGNAAAAGLAGLLGYRYGFVAVFGLMAAMACASIIATLFIRPGDIDHDAARGAEHGADAPIPAAGLSVLFKSQPLLLVGATMALFHLANGAMLPLLGQSMVARGETFDPSVYTAATVLIAQITMIGMALLAAAVAQTRGYAILFVAALIALPLRGAIAAFVLHPLAFVPVQILDGVGAGLLGVALPGLVARILAGTGRVNAGLGAVMTLQGVGAAFSTTLGGYVAQAFGYQTAFMVLAAIAATALALWIVLRSSLHFRTM